MQIQENISLKPFNTFGIDVSARYFAEAESAEQLKEYVSWSNSHSIPLMVLGGGSNVLFQYNYPGLILKNSLAGIEKVNEDEEYVYIKVGAGEVWHHFVLYCLANNYGGVENLALIPGSVGASPMQNIGAYGVEIKEVFHGLNALHRTELTLNKFNNSDCEFGYRESIFKSKLKNQFIITDVTYCLRKTPVYKIDYGAIKQELEKQNVQDLSIQAIAQAVIAIRSSKLPDPQKIGNAGSFFKNPSVTKQKYQQLKLQFPSIVAYENADGTVKLAAGWLIEQAGMKGYRRGDAGVHEKQALVLVNYKAATGKSILEISDLVKDKVMEKFGVVLSPEVNIV